MLHTYLPPRHHTNLLVRQTCTFPPGIPGLDQPSPNIKKAPSVRNPLDFLQSDISTLPELLALTPHSRPFPTPDPWDLGKQQLHPPLLAPSLEALSQPHTPPTMHNHHRRKSGNTSMTDVRKAVTASDPTYKKHSSRPPAMTRRTTPQTVPKLGKNPRDREKELEDERWWDEERESFPQYWYVVNPVLRSTAALRLAPFPSKHCRFHPPAYVT